MSYLQQIGCNNIVTNDGYNYKPLQKANIGVAIGYKDIRVNGKIYRLFVFGARGDGYEEEWAVNMRVGTEGDATGFQEARDGALGFIMPYIKKHTEGLNGDVNVKVWGSGYCRGGTTTNMVFGWLNKWVYERNNGSPYKDYTQSYNKDHSVFGTSYSASDMRYTGTVNFDPKTYLANNVKMSQGDLYAYPVNCPFGADSTEAATDTDSEADKYEAQLESKYTTHLYAQWKDKGNTPQATTAKTSAKTSATTTQSKTPVTGDAMMPIILFISVIVLAAAVVLITAFNKRRNKR